MEIRVENCGGSELTGVEVRDSFSNEAQPFETDDPGNVTISPAPNPNNGMVKESLTWTVGTVIVGQTRTLKIKVGTEFNPSGRLEPTSAPQTIFYNGQDNNTGSASVTADGGLSASVGAVQISNGAQIRCVGSLGQWDMLKAQSGQNIRPHDKCARITTTLPISLEDSDQGTTTLAARASTVEAGNATPATQGQAANGLGGFLAGVVEALQGLVASLVAFLQNLF